MEPITALIVSVPPTIAALAAWRNARAAKEQTNSAMTDRFNRLDAQSALTDAKIDRLDTRLFRVERCLDKGR